MKRATIVACVLLAGSAHADSKPKPVTARVVDIEVHDDARYVTVLAGTEQGIGKGWRARFRAGTTTKPLPDGAAILIRVDKRTAVLKTSLSVEQIRANRTIQLER